MVANLKNTCYLEMCKHSVNIPLKIDNNNTITPAEKGKYTYLGMLFIPTNDVGDIIEANLKQRSFNIKKYFDWLAIHNNSPIRIKLQILDSCMFSAYLYGIETWWKIDKYAETILTQERKMLKIILGVKKGTSNDLIYIKLKQPDIISRTKDLQYKFNQKICTTQIEDAVVANAYAMCKELPVYKYYNQLSSDNQKVNKSNRITNVKNSNSSMFLR